MSTQQLEMFPEDNTEILTSYDVWSYRLLGAAAGVLTLDVIGGFVTGGVDLLMHISVTPERIAEIEPGAIGALGAIVGGLIGNHLFKRRRHNDKKAIEAIRIEQSNLWNTVTESSNTLET